MNSAERVALCNRVLEFLGDNYDSEAYCLTVIPGRTPAEVLEGFGVVSPEAAEVGDVAWYGPTVAVIEASGYVLAVEWNGWQGRRAEVLRRVSPQGRVASLFRNVNAVTALTLWQSGAVLFSEEVLGQPQVAPELASYFEGLDFDAEPVEGEAYESAGWWTSSIAVIERFSGVRLEGHPASSPLTTYRVLPWLDDRRASDGEAWGSSDDDAATNGYHHDPLGVWAFGEQAYHRLVEQVREARPPDRRRLALWAVTQALRDVGLVDDPRLVTTLASFRQQGLPVLAPETDLWMRESFIDVYDEPTPVAYNALKALESALDPDSMGSALGAVCRAGYDVLSREHTRRHPGGGSLAAPLSVEMGMGYTSSQQFLEKALVVLHAGDHQ
ncbi:MAG: DUF6461 domain-containing protein [Lapillicoccus sp.]